MTRLPEHGANVLRPAVFLDRDGTIIRDTGYPHRAGDVGPLDNAVEGMRELSRLGFRLFIATNQSGVARGLFTEEDVQRFHRTLCDRLARDGVWIDGVYYCPFHPTEGVGEYRRESPLRKPAPGMLLRAAADHGLDLRASYMIGDKKSDVLAGRRAGCRTILVHPGRGSADGGAGWEARPDGVAADLMDAARIVWERGPRPGRVGG